MNSKEASLGFNSQISRLTRRSFLRNAGIIGAGMALAPVNTLAQTFTPPPLPSESPLQDYAITSVARREPEVAAETLKDIPTLLIDFDYTPACGVQRDEINQLNVDILNTLLKDQSVDFIHLYQKYINKDLNIYDELSSHAELLLIAPTFLKFTIHVPETILPVMNHVFTQFGYQSICPRVIALQESLDRNLKPWHDAQGNNGAIVTLRNDLEHGDINDKLSETDNGHPLVGIASQFGEEKLSFAEIQVESFQDTLAAAFLPADSTDSSLIVEQFNELNNDQKKAYLYEHMQPIPKQMNMDSITDIRQAIKVRGAYSDEEAEIHLEQMLELARNHTDKLFFAAIGNFGDDIREVKKHLQEEGKWPENIIFVGQWDSDNPEDQHPSGLAGDSMGADMYVDNKAVGLLYSKEFASASTSVLYACANILYQKGITDIYKIKDILYRFCDKRTYRVSPDRMYSHDGFNLKKTIDTYVDQPEEAAALFNYETFRQAVLAFEDQELPFEEFIGNMFQI